FDTGPGNVLMDSWIDRHEGKEFDKAGAWAATGRVIDALLDQLLDEKYFGKTPPKSTGRELFNSKWLDAKIGALNYDPVDVQATLLELTAATVAAAINSHSAAGEVYVCGGGAQNDALMQRLSDLLPKAQVGTTELLGVHPDWVEATAFAWISRQTLAGIPIDTSALTGASEPIVLGGIYKV
ncbi:MAG: anhydro-N-acetylmuramic acid kinase, partial [Gammaproteobacteria bacterium]